MNYKTLGPLALLLAAALVANGATAQTLSDLRNDAATAGDVTTYGMGWSQQRHWGVGNGAPWNAAMRGGDALYTGSVLALRPSTGEVAWHYQFSPADPFDDDGVNELVMAELPMDGKPTKVIMQANRNGFVYVLDRTTGKLLKGDQFARKVNWSSGIDMKTGRPIPTAMTEAVRKNPEMADAVEVWPSACGGKNWMPMSFDPKRKLAFFNTVDLGMTVRYTKQDKPGGPNWWLGLELAGFVAPADGNRGSLVAWGPATGTKAWEVMLKSPNWAGVLTTEPGLPITWEKDGRQYIPVTSGAATVYGALASDAELANVPAGSSLWTFALSR
ncbi:MAG: hypothetical protein RLZZ584_4017 [Pseudomonadota bacterium]